MSKFYGKKTYMSKKEITLSYSPLFISPNFSDPSSKIKIIDAPSSKKSCHHHLSLNGDMYQQIARIHKIIDKWILLTSITKLSKHNGVYAYHKYLLGCLCHLHATTCIKKADWHLMEKTLSKNVFHLLFKQSFPTPHSKFIILKWWYKPNVIFNL